MKTNRIVDHLQSSADYYIQQLRSGNYEAAFHGVIDLDPEILHPLIAAYRVEKEPKISSSLLRIIYEFRNPLAVPLLRDALRERSSNRWKLALDGLVTIATLEAIRILEDAINRETGTANPDSNYIEWVREALQQTQEAYQAKSQTLS